MSARLFLWAKLIWPKTDTENNGASVLLNSWRHGYPFKHSTHQRIAGGQSILFEKRRQKTMNDGGFAETMKRIIFLCLILLQGCASVAELSHQQANMLATMSESEAGLIVQEIFAQTDEQSGLFFSNRNDFPRSPEIVRINDGTIVFKDYISYDSDTRVEGAGSLKKISITTYYKKEDFLIDFRKLRKIRIMDPKVIRKGSVASRNGTQFSLYFDNGITVTIDVKKENSEKVLPVAKFYRPDVRMIMGSGF